MFYSKESREKRLEEQVLARLRAENVEYTDEKAAIACLEECVMPTACINAYKKWLSGNGSKL